MKRLILIVVLACALAGMVFAFEGVYSVDRRGSTVDPGQLHTPHNRYVVIATTVNAGDEPNALAVGERTYLLALAAAEGGDSKIEVYPTSGTLAGGDNRVQFWCIGITDGANIIYDIHAGTLGKGTDCELEYMGELDFTIGTQASTTATYEMADAVTVTPSDSVLGWSSVSPGGNRVAAGRIDLDGKDFVIVVPTTVGCNAKLLAKFN